MQKIEISGFLGIECSEVFLDGLTALIGPQASGKSVIARLLFFCSEYFADFDEVALMKNEHKKTYDGRKREEFYKLFPQYSWHDDSFCITYYNKSHFLKLESKRSSSSLDISTSPSVAASFRALKKAYHEFSDSLPEDMTASPTRIMREFRMHRSDVVREMQLSHALFVPAARSFYATLREEIFSVLSLDEKIDQIIMQFGEFYEGAKYRLDFEWSRGRKNWIYDHYMEYFLPIVKANYSREDGRDWLESSRGRIEMSKASSGQQEAFPLLCAISQFPAPGRTLIIEEPEAHLFPSAQVHVLDFIVRQAERSGVNIFFTTHSPYLLSALNNYIQRGLLGMPRGLSDSRTHAYALDDGKVVDIFDRDDGLISADYIDSVSEKIELEFMEILEARNALG